MRGGVSYERIDDDGLHVKTKDGGKQTLAVDTVVVCAGQESDCSLEAPLLGGGHARVFKIGGAQLAAELDAKRAIDQGSRLAATIETAEPSKMDELVAPLGLGGWLFSQIARRKAA